MNFALWNSLYEFFAYTNFTLWTSLIQISRGFTSKKLNWLKADCCSKIAKSPSFQFVIIKRTFPYRYDCRMSTIRNDCKRSHIMMTARSWRAFWCALNALRSFSEVAFHWKLSSVFHGAFHCLAVVVSASRRFLHSFLTVSCNVFKNKNFL